MKQALFWTFLSVFAATALITLLGITDLLAIDKEYLSKLFYLLILEAIAPVIALFKKTAFFGDQLALDSAKSLCGLWWELVHNHPDIALSFVEIQLPPGQSQIKLVGTAYDHNGTEVARWWSEGACLNNATLELFYYWRGDELTGKNIEKDFSGVSLIQFRQSADIKSIDYGAGWFTSGNIMELQVEGKRKVDMQRLNSVQRTMMVGGESRSKSQLALSVFSEWRANLPKPKH